MKSFFSNANRFFGATLDLRSRLLVFLGILIVIPTFLSPLWEMTLYSNQFPEGLKLYIYSHKLEGERTAERDDLAEINALNHYIGMRPLREDDFTEFKWIPFVLGGVMLLAFRAIVLGTISKLVDVFVLFSYFGLFSLWSFHHKLFLYGHELAPTAAVKVAPFSPPMFGHQTLANFEVYSFPAIGSYCMALVPLFFLAAMWFSRPSVSRQQIA